MSKTEISIGPGFMGCLALLFIYLKLTGYIDWDWIWVVAPVWIPLCIILFVLAVVLLALIIGEKL
jgi:hypothetical protein